MSKPYQQHDEAADRGKAIPHPKRVTARTSRGRCGITMQKRGARWAAFVNWTITTKALLDPWDLLRSLRSL